MLNFYSLSRRIKRARFPGKDILNSFYYSPKYTIIKMENFDYVVIDGCKFLVDDQLESIQRIEGNPWFRNVRETDICLDIGSNIGSITIPLARKASRGFVYSMEPLFADSLKKNIELNGLGNIKVLELGIWSRSGTQKVEFSSRQGSMRVMTFKELLELVGHVDWMKIDCEGAEWWIDPNECKGIRELRLEFHIRKHHKKQDYLLYNKWLRWLEEEKYTYYIIKAGPLGPGIPFSDIEYVNASKKGI